MTSVFSRNMMSKMQFSSLMPTCELGLSLMSAHPCCKKLRCCSITTLNLPIRSNMSGCRISVIYVELLAMLKSIVILRFHYPVELLVPR
ncbi:hypothetical protein LINGRAHAP2_LOCUS19607 [Linum grandiflorum]